MATVTRLPLQPLALLCVTLCLAGQAKADVIVEFNASGRFQDGSSLSGTITIDTTIGTATAADLTVGTPGGMELDSASPNDFGVIPDLISTPSSQTYEIRLFARKQISLSFAREELINIILPVASLDGYSGGSIALGGGGLNSGYFNGFLSPQPGGLQSVLSIGELTADSTAVPEPTVIVDVCSILLLVAGHRCLRWRSVRRTAPGVTDATGRMTPDAVILSP